MIRPKLGKAFRYFGSPTQETKDKALMVVVGMIILAILGFICLAK